MSLTTQPIGIFDSGIGGTSIWKEIHQLLPKEDIVYLADSKNAPYGQKTKQQIIELCHKNTSCLLEKGCKLIVVACNTATTNAISELRKQYKVPFIGIEPAIKPASIQTKNNTIGILATKGTLNSELFEKTSSNLPDQIKIIEQVGEGLVELIEQGRIDSQEMDDLLRKHLAPMLEQQIDCLVLGCTHYPYLIPKIRTIAGDTLQIIDSGEAVAKQTQNVLLKHGLVNTQQKTGRQEFYSNTDITVLKTILSQHNNITVETLDF